MQDRKYRVKGFVQRIYIAWELFMSNDLFTYASAGAYSFLMSALPIVLMVLVILVRIFKASPEVLIDLLMTSKLFQETFDVAPIITSITSIRSVGILEIILGASIFWMARRFFASIQQSMKIIYLKRGKDKPIQENLIIIAGEVIVVILVVLAVISFMAGKAFMGSGFSAHLFSPSIKGLFMNLFRFAPLGLTFLFLVLVYYFTPRERPPFSGSVFAAAACTVAFGVFQAMFTSFVNMAKYNLVYGILSNLIVLLLEVYFFFFCFLFFAQFLYVVQFFESFLLARLYLLPGRDDPDPVRQIERILFIDPPFFYRRYAVSLKAGDVVFRYADDSTELYYVWRGTIRLNMPNRVMEVVHGQMFGEFSSIIGGSRTATAVALTDAVLLKLPEELFRETIKVDGKTSRHTLRLIADYVRKKNDAPLFPDSEL